MFSSLGVLRFKNQLEIKLQATTPFIPILLREKGWDYGRDYWVEKKIHQQKNKENKQ